LPSSPLIRFDPGFVRPDTIFVKDVYRIAHESHVCDVEGAVEIALEFAPPFVQRTENPVDPLPSVDDVKMDVVRNAGKVRPL
jgi:hypothetical protein